VDPPRSRPRLRRAALLLGAAIAAGCGGDDPSPYFGSTTRTGKDPGTFYVNNSSEPEYLDPGKCADGSCAVLVTQLFEGLTHYDPRDAHPVAGVATSWDQSRDNRLFRFHLRPDARWSDGKQVTAHDFAYAWKRVLRPSLTSRSAPHLYALKNGELFNVGKLQALRAGRALLREPREGAPEAATLPRGTVVRVLERSKGWALVERYTDLPTYRSAAAPRSPANEPRGHVPEADLVSDDAVVGVRATDDLTLEIELEQPTPYFLDLTSHHSLCPVRKDVVEPFEQRGEAELWVRPEHLVNNGPYMLDQWKFQYEITLKENPFYWDRSRLKIHRVVVLFVEDYHATMNLYKAAEIDYIGDALSLPLEYVPVLKAKRDYRVNPYLSVYGYEFNMKKPPVNDLRVRQALDLAVDKKQIVEKLTRAGQQPATHYVPDYTGLGYADQVAEDRRNGVDPFTGPGVDYDPERARALLAEAGYPVVAEGGGLRAAGFPPLEVLYNTSTGHQQIAVAIQDMWRRNLGVTVALRNEEWKVMLKNYRDGNFQVIRIGAAADYNHPQTFLEPFLTGNPQNQSGFSDPAFDRTMREAAATADPRESIRLYRKAEKIAVDGMPRIPIYFYVRISVVKPWVKGFWGSTRNPHAIQYLWIDPAWKTDAPNVPAYPPPELPPPGPWEAAPW
jgi:oligopeptide transport system substrate-binding protein